MTTAQEPIRAYHLLPADGRLARGDGREVRVGETLEVEVEPELCERGLHASRRCLDTLQYSPGESPRLCLVEVSGNVREGADKICGRRRKVTAMLTSAATSKVLQEFAIRVAEMALEVAEGKGNDVAAGRKAVEMARRYRRGDCTEAELVAARDAVWAAGYAACAAGHAAWVTWAAGHAAWAAGHAAWAAGDAAGAARYAARTARYAAGADVSRDQLAAVLEGMVTETFAQGAV